MKENTFIAHLNCIEVTCLLWQNPRHRVAVHRTEELPGQAVAGCFIHESLTIRGELHTASPTAALFDGAAGNQPVFHRLVPLLVPAKLLSQGIISRSTTGPSDRLQKLFLIGSGAHRVDRVCRTGCAIRRSVDFGTRSSGHGS